MNEILKVLMKKNDLVCKYLIQKVRIPISCSLHEIAKIIGPEAAAKDILPHLVQILKDKSISIEDYN